MNRSKYFNFAVAGLILGAGATLVIGDAREQYLAWDVHDTDRPQPPVIDPGYASTPEKVGKAPSDAIVLFDGTSADAFHNGKNEPAGWEITEEGTIVRLPGKGDLITKQSFGDVQAHFEFMTPKSMADRKGQGKGNSGAFFMQRYEVQVLNNYNNDTYADGMVGSIYGQFPPMVNPSRDIEEWQTYDIIFRRPHFNEDGSLKTPATLTIFLNGVLVQDNQELMGPTTHKRRTAYKAHADKLPIRFQNHGEECHYRNIWVRELPPRDNPRPYEN